MGDELQFPSFGLFYFLPEGIYYVYLKVVFNASIFGLFSSA